VSMDLRKMGVNEWRDRARNREAWRHIVRPRPTPGCRAFWRRRAKMSGKTIERTN